MSTESGTEEGTARSAFKSSPAQPSRAERPSSCLCERGGGGGRWRQPPLGPGPTQRLTAPGRPAGSWERAATQLRERADCRRRQPATGPEIGYERVGFPSLSASLRLTYFLHLRVHGAAGVARLPAAAPRCLLPPPSVAASVTVFPGGSLFSWPGTGCVFARGGGQGGWRLI